MANRLAIIPARSGSKGLANKNILMLMGKPLIAYTIEAAVNSKCFSKVIVSTDSIEYKYIAEQYGAEVLIRNERLASDTATSFMVIEDVLKNIEVLIISFCCNLLHHFEIPSIYKNLLTYLSRRRE